MKKSKIRKLSTNTNGVVGIIATILIIGLIISFIGVIKTVQVPQWLEQKEAEHMTEVENQFTQLKCTLDMVSLLRENITISNYITLGSQEIPFFNEGRTYETLEISSNYGWINFTAVNNNLFSFNISGIRFLSNNQHYVNQIMCIEAGALLLSQPPNSILLGQPIMSISNFTNVTISLFNFSGLGGKSFVSGYGTYVLSNEFIGRNKHIIHDIDEIQITSSYPEAWADFFNSSSFKRSGLDYNIMIVDDKTVHIMFSEILENLELDVINIQSQLAIWRY